jgi:hypothetical protein
MWNKLSSTAVQALGYKTEICEIFSLISLFHYLRKLHVRLLDSVKVKAKLFLCLLKFHAIKMFNGVEA